LAGQARFTRRPIYRSQSLFALFEVFANREPVLVYNVTTFMALTRPPADRKDQNRKTTSIEGEWAEQESPRQKAEPTSVLLVDDHVLVRRALRCLLQDSPHIVVVAEAGDGIAAVDMARELEPRVVMMDCALPRLSGLMATRTISKNLQHTHVLMLSMYAEDTWVRNAFKFGARGYILKNAVSVDLVTAVQRIAVGEIVLDPQLARPQTLKGERPHGLTIRELQVLQQVVAGRSNKEIARRLAISINTVAVHRSNIMQALNIHNAAALAAYAVDNGLVTAL